VAGAAGEAAGVVASVGGALVSGAAAGGGGGGGVCVCASVASGVAAIGSASIKAAARFAMRFVFNM
jgi:hypothetical protein